MKSAVFTSSAKQEEQHDQSAAAVEGSGQSSGHVSNTLRMEASDSQFSLCTDGFNCQIITAAGSDVPTVLRRRTQRQAAHAAVRSGRPPLLLHLEPAAFSFLFITQTIIYRYITRYTWWGSGKLRCLIIGPHVLSICS